jgi:hypothetical protein
LDSQWFGNVDVAAFQKLIKGCRLVSLSFILPLPLCLLLSLLCLLCALPLLLPLLLCLLPFLLPFSLCFDKRLACFC